MEAFKALSTKTLATMLERRHPDYNSLVSHWDFLIATYLGGRAWFCDHIFQYYKEGDDEFAKRVKRAYRFNHTREVVDLVNKYVFRGEVHRNTEDASPVLKAFWSSATRGGKPIDELMRSLSKQSSIFGRIWVVVDAINHGTGESKAEAKTQIYAYDVNPQNVLDMSFDDDGELNWILIREVARDDDDPIDSSGEEYYRYRFWTRQGWALFEEDNRGRKEGEQAVFRFVDSGLHNLGIVPVFPVDHMESESLYSSSSMIGDVAYLDRACANYLSNLDAIIQDQTFSQLAVPAQGLLPGEEGHQKVLEAGTKRIFTYDSEGGAPFFLSPDPKQAELIITSIKQIINEIYHSVGVAGERTKQDNSMGIDNSSGVAKAYDFERVNSLLVNKAQGLESAEYKLANLVSLWAGEKPIQRSDNRETTDLIAWPTDFESRGLYDELDIANRFELLTVPIELKRYQLKQTVKKLYPFMAEAERKELFKAIDDMTDELLTAVDSTFGQGNAADPQASDAEATSDTE